MSAATTILEVSEPSIQWPCEGAPKIECRRHGVVILTLVETIESAPYRRMLEVWTYCTEHAWPAAEKILKKLVRAQTKERKGKR